MFLSTFIAYALFISMMVLEDFFWREAIIYLFYLPGHTLFVTLRKLAYFSQLTVKTNIVLPGKSGGCLADQGQAFQSMSVPLPECG